MKRQKVVTRKFQQDFTDFDYNAYTSRYGKPKNIIEEIGLKAVDKATTPIIVRTPWGFTDDLPNFLEWHRAYDWNHSGKYVPHDMFYQYALGGKKNA